MEFLKEVLGDELYKQVESKINSHNEANKDKQIKIADLSSGEYVSKSKYDSLETDLNNTKISLNTANTTIEDLKKSNTSNEDLQKKIKDYETEKNTLETEFKEKTSKLIKEQAIREALYNEKAKHPELLLSKFDLSKILLDEKGEKVVSGITEQINANKETYKDLFGSENDKPGGTYQYVPGGGSSKSQEGAIDFVGIIKENQARKY